MKTPVQFSQWLCDARGQAIIAEIKLPSGKTDLFDSHNHQPLTPFPLPPHEVKPPAQLIQPG